MPPVVYRVPVTKSWEPVRQVFSDWLPKVPNLENSRHQIEAKEAAIKTMIMESTEGTFGVIVKWLASSETIKINPEEPFYAASLTKVALLMTLSRLSSAAAPGDLYHRAAVVAYQAGDYEAGDGSIQYDPVGTSYSLADIAIRTARDSDNIAKNILYRILPWSEIQATYQLVGVPPNTQANVFTPSQMAVFWEYLWNNQETYSEVLTWLQDTTTEERIPAGVASKTPVSHKTGTWPATGSWHDCGIVLTDDPVLICILSKDSSYEEAVDLIRDITKLVIS